MILISIIIPAYNIQVELGQCIDKLFCQTFSQSNYEVLVVDDRSTDNTYEVALSYVDKMDNFRCFQLDENKGPGAARNKGIKESVGEFILFLDGDDFLPSYTLEELWNTAKKNKSDAVTFNWSFVKNEFFSSLDFFQPFRNDIDRFSLDKNKLIRDFLSMEFDGSVIFTMVSRSLLIDNKIQFSKGLHEDIFVIFAIYFHSKNITILDKVMYLKRNREGSIVNTISKKHIDGYFSSWIDIKQHLLEVRGGDFVDSCMLSYMKGVSGLIAVELIKNQTMNKTNYNERTKIYITIIILINRYFSHDICKYSLPKKTVYDKMTNYFLNSGFENSNILTRESVDIFEKKYSLLNDKKSRRLF
jgi:glycosyltransferase involved in cell wall biosynthesis